MATVCSSVDAGGGGEVRQGLRLGLAVDHGAHDPAGEPAVDHLEHVGPGVVEAQVVDQPVGHGR